MNPNPERQPLGRIYFIVGMFWWTGLVSWELEFPLPCSRACTFLYARNLIGQGYFPAPVADARDISHQRIDSKSWTPHPKLSTFKPQASSLNPQSSTLNPQPSTLNPQPSTLNPQPDGRYGIGATRDLNSPGCQQAKETFFDLFLVHVLFNRTEMAKTLWRKTAAPVQVLPLFF